MIELLLGVKQYALAIIPAIGAVLYFDYRANGKLDTVRILKEYVLKHNTIPYVIIGLMLFLMYGLDQKNQAEIEAKNKELNTVYEVQGEVYNSLLEEMDRRLSEQKAEETFRSVIKNAGKSKSVEW